jgi:hypothetical protein
MKQLFYVIKENFRMNKKTDNVHQLKTELIETMAVASKNVIAHLIIEKVSKLFKLPRNFPAPFFASFAFSLGLFFTSWVVDRLFKISISWSEVLYLFIPSFLAGFFVWITKIVEDAIFISNFQFLSDIAVDEEGIIELREWFKRFFVLWPQYVLFLIIGFIGVASSIPIVSNLAVQQNLIGIYLGIFFCSGMIGQGTYFALMLPTVGMTVSKHRLNLYPYNPVKSPSVQVASSIIGILTIGTSVGATS